MKSLSIEPHVFSLASRIHRAYLALAAYELIGDDGRYSVLHDKISSVLRTALIDADGKPLKSFPEYSWPFDTIPVLASLKLYDDKRKSPDPAALSHRHFEWIAANATDSSSGLPYSRIDDATGAGRRLPRGCDLSFRLSLLPHVDAAYAKQMYVRYVASFWLERGMIAGFAEWPNGRSGFQDMDSGPILMGVGLGATGMGFAPAIATGDKVRIARLSEQLAAIQSLKAAFLLANAQSSPSGAAEIGGIKISSDYFTGFLFGDAMLFYSVTWMPWGQSDTE